MSLGSANEVFQWGIQDFLEGAPTPRTGRVPIYYLVKFYRKLHENEEDWAGGRVSKFANVDPPLLTISVPFYLKLHSYWLEGGVESILFLKQKSVLLREGVK